MPGQGYERVGGDDPDVQQSYSSGPIPNSPPPSFHSRNTSPHSLHRRSHSQHDVDTTLAETFDDASDSEDEEDDRQRLVRHNGSDEPAPDLLRRPTIIPSFVPSAHPNSSNIRAMPTSNNDGVFANLNAKPQAGDAQEELPPSYEQAAADATPPYWETTLLAPGMLSDEVYIDGLPVGSFFSFAWNGIIAMAFPLVGFLLTYLLHTTHAARNGSRAGLGVTLVNYGFTMRQAGNTGGDPSGDPAAGGDGMARPADPDSHDFNPADKAIFTDAQSGGADGGASSSHSGDWLAYLLMIAGWIILIKAVADYVRARRHEQLVLQGPDRNLPPPVTAEVESTDHT